jgi:hypothetical protein
MKKSQKVKGFLTFLLNAGMIRIRTNNDRSGSGRTKNLKILRILIHNTASGATLQPLNQTSLSNGPIHRATIGLASSASAIKKLRTIQFEREYGTEERMFFQHLSRIKEAGRGPCVWHKIGRDM